MFGLSDVSETRWLSFATFVKQKHSADQGLYSCYIKSRLKSG